LDIGSGAREPPRERVVIPIHGNQPLKKGLLRALMKIAGLKEGDL
jgi:predicted RNA binding protein YcfA (HicA-like mRNA interferase family)